MVDYRMILRKELAKRMQVNPKYNQTAFARDLGISSSRMSELLQGKHGLSSEWAARIADRIGLSENEKRYFIDLVNSKHARSISKRNAAKERVVQIRAYSDWVKVNEDSFSVISDWFCLALIELIRTSDFVCDIEWIAKRLGLSELQVSVAIEKLDKVGLLKKTGKNSFEVTDYTSAESSWPSMARKKFHEQMLKKAIVALYTEPFGSAVFETVILAVNPEKVAEAKAMIEKFSEEFNSVMDDSDTKQEVYCISTQFFKLTKGNKNEKLS